MYIIPLKSPDFRLEPGFTTRMPSISAIFSNGFRATAYETYPRTARVGVGANERTRGCYSTTHGMKKESKEKLSRRNGMENGWTASASAKHAQKLQIAARGVRVGVPIARQTGN
jgi:hypothetical protein